MPVRRLIIIVLSALAAFAMPAIAGQRGESDALVAPAEVTKADFFRPGLAPVRNAAGYDVTAVYFFDYQCPQCRRYTPDVERVMAEDRRVRWIYRDIPSISPMSRVAARLAIAAAFQGKHAAFHRQLMLSKGRLSEAVIRAAGTRAGLDWKRVDRDLGANRARIEALIDHNSELADFAGIMGTPAFVIGDTLADGALDYKSLKAEIADARAAARKRR